MLEVSQKGIVPPGGYVWICPESSQVFKHPHLHVLEDAAKAHCRANNYPIGANWAASFEDNVCRNSKCPCAELAEPSLPKKIQSLVKALSKWAVEGFPVVTREQYEQREAICLSCPHHTERNSRLTGCRICGCSKQKLQLRTSFCPDKPSRWSAIP